MFLLRYEKHMGVLGGGGETQNLKTKKGGGGTNFFQKNFISGQKKGKK